jgi:toxin ParE1/3/4
VATRLLSAIEAAFQPILQFPLAGPSRDRLSAGLRVTFQSPYAIYYRHFNDTIVIIRILHGARDTASLAEQGAFES